MSDSVDEQKKDGAEEVVYRSSMVNGVPMVPFVTQSKMDKMRKEVTLTEDDIVVQTYPRCGTTWMQQIVLSLLAGEGCADVIDDPMMQSKWMEFSMCHFKKSITIEEFLAWRPDPATQRPNVEADRPLRRVLKTHSTVSCAPWVQDPADEKDGVATIPEGAKVIVVTRHPLPTCLSLYYHTLNTPKGFTGTMDQYVKQLFIPAKSENGCFWEYHKGWMDTKERYPDRVLYIHYEDIKADLRAAIRKVGVFILGEEPKDSLVEAVYNCSTFEAMKATDERVIAEKEAGKRKHTGFIKKDHIGGGKQPLGDDLRDAVMEQHRKRCAELGIDPDHWKSP